MSELKISFEGRCKNNPSPCRNCCDRKIEVIDNKPIRCHASCEKYTEWKEKIDEVKSVINSEKEKLKNVDDYFVRSTAKLTGKKPGYR